MESEDTCNQWSSGECTTFDDSLGKAILRFVWVEPSVLDDFDFVRTVTLVRSFSVGKRMTATLLCDILAHFTRIFRCSSSDTIHDAGKCTKLCLMYNQCFELWKNYDKISKHENQKSKNSDKILMPITKCNTSLPKSMNSYTNPFECYLNLSSVVHTISETANPEKTSCKLDGNQSIIQKSSDVTNPITYLTEHNAKTVQNFHQPLITAPQEKSPAFSGEVADPAVRPLEEEEYESKERLTQKDSITCDPQTEKHEDKSGVSESNSKTTSEVLQMTETLQHQLAWLNLMPKAKPFQWEESSCFRMPQEIRNSHSDARNDGMLSDFINVTQPFKSMWVSDDDDNTADVLTLKSHKADCSEKGSPSSTEVSAILDEISMDISDSFDEWFTNCCNDLPPQLEKLDGLVGTTFDSMLPPQPSTSCDILSSTPLIHEAHEQSDKKNQPLGLKSLWPELPSVGQNARRRLWDDSDIGVCPLSEADQVTSESVLVRRANSETNLKKYSIVKPYQEGSLPDVTLSKAPAPRRVENPNGVESAYAMPQYKFNPPMPQRQSVKTHPLQPFTTFSTDIPGITPIAQPTKVPAGQTKIPTTYGAHSVSQRSDFALPSHFIPHHQAAYLHDVSFMLNGCLPQNQSANSGTHGYTYSQGYFYPNYQLWQRQHTKPPPNVDTNVSVSNQPGYMHNVAAQGVQLMPPSTFTNPRAKTTTTKNVIGHKPPLWSQGPHGLGPQNTNNIAKTQNQLNMEHVARQQAFQQQVLQPPPGIHLPGEAHLQPGISSQGVPGQHHPVYAYQQNPSLYDVQSDNNFSLRHDTQQMTWHPSEQFHHPECKDRPLGGPGSAFKPYTAERQQQVKQDPQYREQQNEIKCKQPSSKQQQFLFDLPPVVDMLPPWRRARPPRLVDHSFHEIDNIDAFSVNDMSGETPLQHTLARASEQLLGQDGPGMFSAGLDGTGLSNGERCEVGGQVLNGLDSHRSKNDPCSKRCSFNTGPFINSTDLPLFSNVQETFPKTDPIPDVWQAQQQKQKQVHQDKGQPYSQVQEAQRQMEQLQKQQNQELKRQEQLQRQKQQQEQQQLHRHQIQRQLQLQQQQQQQLFQQAGQWSVPPPPPPPPALSGTGTASNSHRANFCFPGASNFSVTQQSDYKAMVQAFTQQPPLLQQHPLQAVPSMVEVAWASLGVLPPRAPPPPPPQPQASILHAGGQRYSMARAGAGWGNKN